MQRSAILPGHQRRQSISVPVQSVVDGELCDPVAGCCASTWWASSVTPPVRAPPVTAAPSFSSEKADSAASDTRRVAVLAPPPPSSGNAEAIAAACASLATVSDADVAAAVDTCDGHTLYLTQGAVYRIASVQLFTNGSAAPKSCRQGSPA